MDPDESNEIFDESNEVKKVSWNVRELRGSSGLPGAVSVFDRPPWIATG